jgi:hypothetical protein
VSVSIITYLRSFLIVEEPSLYDIHRLREIEVEVRLVLKGSLNQLEHLIHHPTYVAVQPALMALSARSQ